MQGAFQTLVGGTASEIGGGKFANGAVSAAVVYLFNDMQTIADKVAFGNREDEWHKRNGKILEYGSLALGVGESVASARLAWKAWKSSGGLTLFKWNSYQTMEFSGWKEGTRFLYLPNKYNPKLNWKQNYGRLREEMKQGNPIYDSYLDFSGNQIPTQGFLNAERYLLESRGWTFDHSIGAYIP